MNLLFVHQNCPGQFRHLVRDLLDQGGHRVVFIGQPNTARLPGLERLDYRPAPGPGDGLHPWLRDTDAAVRNGQAVARLALDLKRRGFVPDVMVGHNGWGETLYLKDVWPDRPLLSYFEFFYSATGSDLDFDPEFPPSLDDQCRARTRNAVNLLGLAAADRGLSPTEWQRRQYPAPFRDRIKVVHEGVDTRTVAPDPAAALTFGRDGLTLTRADEVITFSVRNLEPYRGFHVFMRALPDILRRRPRAHVIFVGGDDVSYGRRPPGGRTWRQVMLAELAGRLDMTRLHFLGRIPYASYLRVLQVSQAHVYLTYPFVLSWSMLEAMSAGCAVIGSRTAPVEEVLEDGRNGLLVDFHDTAAIADRIDAILDHSDRMAELRRAARATIVSRYDLETVTLPAQRRLLARLAAGEE
ncbi:putative glycosyltransferase [Caenispirillum salinarum AK4]|uniref:Putative glycosyltransferase n=1 Tax=Caenispirillum salinarum AK4 TaxID=1238182 RepID=K9H8H6_9PROT|nr:glycosyltransferase family 4 protein [Caenispirillum salinarum]EKV26918.1 putative glycosyltransferase [Caenispirillum salinarum AK4]